MYQKYVKYMLYMQYMYLLCAIHLYVHYIFMCKTFLCAMPVARSKSQILDFTPPKSQILEFFEASIYKQYYLLK